MPTSHSTSVWAFIKAVGKHWLTLMSGGIVTVGLSLYARSSQKNIPNRTYLAIIIGFALSGCYLARRDAQAELGKINDKPELKIVFSHEEPFFIILPATIQQTALWFAQPLESV